MGGDKAVKAWNIWNKKVRSELWKQGVYEEVSSKRGAGRASGPVVKASKGGRRSGSGNGNGMPVGASEGAKQGSRPTFLPD